MSFQFVKGLGLSLFIQATVGTAIQCPDVNSNGHACAETYMDDLNDAHVALGDAFHRPPSATINALRNHLEGIVDDTEWTEHWSQSAVDVQYCFAIEPIKERLQNSCLCELNTRCGVVCTKDVATIFSDFTAWELTTPFPQQVSASQCTTVLTELHSKHYDALCNDTPAYRSIYECANPGPPSPVSTGTDSDTATPSPTVIPSSTTTTTRTTSTTTAAPVSDDNTDGDGTTTTGAPSSSEDTSEATSSTSSSSPTLLTTQVDDHDGSGYDFNYYSYGDHQYELNDLNQFDEFQGTLDTPDDLADDSPTTTSDGFLLTDDTDSHPFANLLLVSLVCVFVILGFCVFVAWYAKKNHLWGLQKPSPSSADGAFMNPNHQKTRNARHHKPMHEKLFADDLDDPQVSYKKVRNQSEKNVWFSTASEESPCTWPQLQLATACEAEISPGATAPVHATKRVSTNGGAAGSGGTAAAPAAAAVAAVASRHSVDNVCQAAEVGTPQYPPPAMLSASTSEAALAELRERAKSQQDLKKDEYERVFEWLVNEVELPQYFDVLVKNGYDSMAIIAKTIDSVDALAEIGITAKGHQKTIMMEIEKLCTEGS